MREDTSHGPVGRLRNEMQLVKTGHTSVGYNIYGIALELWRPFFTSTCFDTIMRS
jgi:hypothetical protein